VRHPHHELSTIYAQVEFVPRLYIQHEESRIDFGVRRAFLSISSKQPDGVSKINDGSGPDPRRSSYYVTLLDHPEATTICMNPEEGRSSLEELPLPPAPGENRLSKVARAKPELTAADIVATVSINLSPEGLSMFGRDPVDKPAPATLNKIAAILNVALKKEIASPSGLIRRKITVEDKR